jgi:C-terminal processing protease CtpA/Prc
MAEKSRCSPFAGSAGGRFLDDAFGQMQRRSSQSLIIDVRNNSGGADGKFHNTKHPNWGIQQPSQPHFAGKVIAVMNGGSFSTTCEFLSNLHFRKRATFLGEEAAGGYYGNTSGRMPVVVLPNSKVVVRVPLQTYYLAVKGADPRRSILPDVEVKPAIRDLLVRDDPVMAKALAIASNH